MEKLKKILGYAALGSVITVAEIGLGMLFGSILSCGESYDNEDYDEEDDFYHFLEMD